MLAVVVVLVVPVLAVLLWVALLLLLGFWLRFAIGLGFGDRFEVGKDFVLEVSGDQCRAGGLHGLLRGCSGLPSGRREAYGSLFCGGGFGLGRGFVDEVDREGGGGGRGR